MTPRLFGTRPDGARPLPPGPRGRILFLGPFNGGVGGIERLTRTFALWAEGSGFAATMLFRNVFEPGPFTVTATEHVQVLGEAAWGAALAETPWDYVYVIPSGLDKKVWIPRVQALRGVKVGLEMDLASPWFDVCDVLHVEAPREAALPKPHVVATPDPRPTIPRVAPCVRDAFYLTVFTPYGPEKGHEHIPAFLEGTGARLVWFYDLASFAARGRRWEKEIRARVDAVRHPRLELGEAPSQEDVYRAYGASSGYVCFSDREGLGWSMLDAIALEKPLAARRIGICRAIEGFVPTDDFAAPVFRTYPMPATISFEGLFDRIPAVLGPRGA